MSYRILLPRDDMDTDGLLFMIRNPMERHLETKIQRCQHILDAKWSFEWKKEGNWLHSTTQVKLTQLLTRECPIFLCVVSSKNELPDETAMEKIKKIAKPTTYAMMLVGEIPSAKYHECVLWGQTHGARMFATKFDLQEIISCMNTVVLHHIYVQERARKAHIKDDSFYLTGRRGLLKRFATTVKKSPGLEDSEENSSSQQTSLLLEG